MTVLPESPAICDLGYVIDIVAHSMGYAHTIGVLSGLIEDENGDSFLAGGYTFGNFYILAPENACSGFVNNLNGPNSNLKLIHFENVWQYGTWEMDKDANGEYIQNDDRHLPWQQDGVAPQCPVPGLLFDQTVPTSPLPNSNGTYQAGRIKFDGKPEHLNFLEAHYGENYGWIFKIPASDPDGGGVRRRN